MLLILDKKSHDTQDTDKSTDPAAAHDPWHDWKPQWNKTKGADIGTQTPHDQQERQNPTEGVYVRSGRDKEQDLCQRRIVDARLWESMTPHQQEAALHIAFAFETMGKGLGYVTSNWARIPGGGHGGDIAAIHGRMITTYIAWTQRCHKAHISHSMIIDVLCFGFTCSALDRDRRVRTGKTRENLMDGLSLYCEIMGWPKR